MRETWQQTQGEEEVIKSSGSFEWLAWCLTSFGKRAWKFLSFCASGSLVPLSLPFFRIRLFSSAKLLWTLVINSSFFLRQSSKWPLAIYFCSLWAHLLLTHSCYQFLDSPGWPFWEWNGNREVLIITPKKKVLPSDEGCMGTEADWGNNMTNVRCFRSRQTSCRQLTVYV